MLRRTYVQNKLADSLKCVTNFYNTHHSKSDNIIQSELGIPFNSDIFVICLIDKTGIKIYKLYILNDETEIDIDGKIQKLVENMKEVLNT